MLLFRYTKPDIDIVPAKEGINRKPLTIREYIKRRKIDLVSTNPEKELYQLLEIIVDLKRNAQVNLHDKMREAFLPESLKPIQLEDFPGSYTELTLYVECLQIYYNYVKENYKQFACLRSHTTKLLQTIICIKNDKMILLTEDVSLNSLIKNKVKEYKKYGIVYSEEEDDI